MLLMMDSTVLVLLGLAFILAPRQIEAAFHFENLPAAVSFLIGLWGCTLLTMGIGYGVAAFDPQRHVLWVIVGIARGVLEALVAGWCLSREMVTWKQSGFGLLLAAFMALGYILLYPRQSSSTEWKSSP
jgi:hypothetical protein